MTKERVNVYFNLELQEERELWDYINKKGKRSYLIKKALWLAMKAEECSIKPVVAMSHEKNETPTIEELKKEIEKPSNTIPQNNEPLKAEDFDDSIFA